MQHWLAVVTIAYKMVCSIGLCLKRKCTVGKLHRSSRQFSSREWNLFKLRSGVFCLKTVCESHANQFGRLYAAQQKQCCNPLKVHANIRRKNLKTISTKYHEDFHHYIKDVIEGRKICIQCDRAVRENATKVALLDESLEKENHAENDDMEIPSQAEAWEDLDAPEIQNDNDDVEAIVNLESSFSTLNTTLESLGQSPITKTKVNRSKKYPVEKYSKATKALKTSFDAVLSKECISQETNSGSGQYAAAGEEMIRQLKDKFRICEKASDKIQMLSVLPKSWSVRKIQNEFECSERLVRNMKKCVEEKGIICSPNPKKGHPLSEDVVQKVLAFYREADVSKELAGKKEFKSVREGTSRVLKQKRLVLSNLSETFSFFKEKFPEIDIGFSKFAELRPPECVLAGAAGTHTVCVCVIHQNFKLKFLGAKFHEIEAEVGGAKAFNSYRDVLKQSLCDPPTEACFLNTCSNTACGDLDSIRSLIWSYLDDNSIEEITYKQWTQQERCSLETKVSDAESFVETFIEAVPDVRKHDYIAAKQAEFYQFTRDNLHEGEVLVVADFSENYSFVFQDSVQGVHYNNLQATVHPFAAYFLERGKVVPLNCIMISDVLEHSTAIFHAFQRKFVEFLKSRLPKLTKIIYFSDGAGSQYKNRFNVTNLLFHEEDFGIPAEWHYFATAHGKGPSDGLGGTLKRLATRASLQGTTIQTPKELYEWARSNCNLNVQFVTSEQCNEEKKDLETRFGLARSIPGIRGMHSATPATDGTVFMKTVSCSVTGSNYKVISKPSKNSSRKPKTNRRKK